MLNSLVAAASARLQLRDDWPHIVRHAWSIRWLIAAGLLDGTEAVFSIVASSPPIPLNVFAPLDFVVTALAFWARIASQQNMMGPQTK